jgi:hypothetical protein
MQRLTRYLAVATLVAACVAGGAAAHARAAATICVGAGKGCYQALQPAFDAAHDGDTIKIAAGTYAGGVTVDASVKIVGAGAGKTIIKGGGPVLTIGKGEAGADKLNVSISGVTVTGGVSTGVPDPNAPSSVAGGGGIFIPSSQDTVGATVTIRDSVITGNRATPTSTEDSGEPCPGGVDCPSADGFGGGIADVGRLTLIDTVVSDNVAGGGVASSAHGGGIWTATNGGPGALTLVDSTVTRNKASVTAPNGRHAEGGGIEVQDGEAFVVRDSTVSDNLASVSNTYSSEDLQMLVDSAGIHIGGFGTATIEGSRITGNTASADDPGTTVGAIDAALTSGFSDFCACGQTLDLSNSVISNNHAITNAASTDNGPDGDAVEIDSQATISDTRIVDNTTTVATQASSQGSVAAMGAFFAFDNDAGSIVMSDSAIDGNTVTTSSKSGPAIIQGGGLTNGGSLDLRNVEIKGNSADAEGDGGLNQGAGIWNGEPFGPGNTPPPQLTLDNTSVTKNVLTGSAGVTLQGGGLFTLGFPIPLGNSTIEKNVPDQCYGC